MMKKNIKRSNRKTENTLDGVGIGEVVTVSSLVAEGPMRRRLQDVGFCSGSSVRCVMKSPLGDPAAYLVRGTLIALRREDAGNIVISR